MKSIFKLIELVLKNGTREAADATIMTLQNWKARAWLLLIAFVFFVGLGMAIGANADTLAGIAWGKGLIAVGAVIGLLISIGFLVGSGVIVHIFAAVATSDTEAKATEKQKKETHKQVAGYVAWVSFVTMYVLLVPVYRHVYLTLVVAICAVIVSSVGISRWWESKWPRVVMVSLVGIVMVFATARLAFVRFDDLVNEHASFLMGTDGDSDGERLLIRKAEERIAEIQDKAAEECDGEYCTAEDKAEVERLERKLELLKTGKHWKNAGVKASEPTAQALPTVTLPETAPEPVQAEAPAVEAPKQEETIASAPAPRRPVPNFDRLREFLPQAK